MPLTRYFRDTVKARAGRDSEFRFGLSREAIEALLSDDLETGKAFLRDYVNATVGFEALAAEISARAEKPHAHAFGQGKPSRR